MAVFERRIDCEVQQTLAQLDERCDGNRDSALRGIPIITISVSRQITMLAVRTYDSINMRTSMRTCKRFRVTCRTSACPFGPWEAEVLAIGGISSGGNDATKPCSFDEVWEVSGTSTVQSLQPILTLYRCGSQGVQQNVYTTTNALNGPPPALSSLSFASNNIDATQETSGGS